MSTKGISGNVEATVISEALGAIGISLFGYGLYLIYQPLIFIFFGFVLCGFAAHLIDKK